mgnify:CR=1 FL=1
MAPYELRGMTVKQLSEIRKAMTADVYRWEIEKLPMEKQKESAWMLHLTQTALLKMRNAELSAIRDQLLVNEADLTTGTSQLQQVLDDLTKTEHILTQVAGFLKIVARIVPLVLG